MEKTSRQAVYEAIDGERSYQDRFWSDLDPVNSVGDFLSYIRRYVDVAVHRVNPKSPGESLEAIRKIAALAVACMEQHGAPARKG